MSPEMIGAIGILVLLILLFCKIWIGMAMAFVGILGFACLKGFDLAFISAAMVPMKYIAYYPITVLPMFVFMGVLLSNTGVSGDIYKTAHAWFGRLRGGLAIATIIACAGLAAIMGSSVAEAVTMGKVAVPEMKKFNYDDKLSTGCVAAGGTLGFLIPPSLGFILYGILTENSIGALFMAGILPGVVLSLMFIITIIIITWLDPKAGPQGPATSFREKIVSVKDTWPVVILFVAVIGGIYGGIFTPTEAGALGAFCTFIIAGIKKRLTYKIITESIREATQTTVMVALLMMGAYIFMKFLAISKLTVLLSSTICGFEASPYVILAAIIVLYIILGMFLDVMAAIIITLPVIYPIVIALGFDPIWYGVIMALLMELGLITPPVGINVFAIAGVCNVP